MRSGDRDGMPVADGRVPWDVPVRLVGADGVVGDRIVRTVRIGVDLAGVVAVRVTSVRSAGVLHLEGIDPAPGAGADGDLTTLLDDHADAGGTVPVLIAGTPFARDVFGALLRVGRGHRVTYGELAAASGHGRAVRAVGSVMARNRLPLVLPCHRIVPSSGGTGAYAWGGAVKSALLEVEAALPARAVR